MRHVTDFLEHLELRTIHFREVKMMPISTASYSHMSEWRYRLTVLDLGTRWKLAVNFLDQPIYTEGKILWY
jgi:hypothetical protein